VSTPPIEDPNERIALLLGGWAAQLGRDAVPYGNHVRRVVGLVRAQLPLLHPAQLGQLAVAAAFHDIGIWLDGTFDYLEPSCRHAAAYLEAEGLAVWEPVVTDMIMLHHQVRPVHGKPLVDAFRRADWCDVSMGALRRGYPKGKYAALRKEFPFAGFHQKLVALTAKQVRRHPLRPLPMFRY
jgi:hypothetical protein